MECQDPSATPFLNTASGITLVFIFFRPALLLLAALLCGTILQGQGWKGLVFNTLMLRMTFGAYFLFHVTKNLINSINIKYLFKKKKQQSISTICISKFFCHVLGPSVWWSFRIRYAG